MSREYNDDWEEKTLYRVIVTYGGDRNAVIIKEHLQVADSGDYAEKYAIGDNPFPKAWEKDYIQVQHEEVSTVRVKRKPREIMVAK